MLAGIADNKSTKGMLDKITNTTMHVLDPIISETIVPVLQTSAFKDIAKNMTKVNLKPTIEYAINDKDEFRQLADSSLNILGGISLDRLSPANQEKLTNIMRYGSNQTVKEEDKQKVVSKRALGMEKELKKLLLDLSKAKSAKQVKDIILKYTGLDAKAIMKLTSIIAKENKDEAIEELLSDPTLNKIINLIFSINYMSNINKYIGDLGNHQKHFNVNDADLKVLIDEYDVQGYGDNKVERVAQKFIGITDGWLNPFRFKAVNKMIDNIQEVSTAVNVSRNKVLDETRDAIARMDSDLDRIRPRAWVKSLGRGVKDVSKSLLTTVGLKSRPKISSKSFKEVMTFSKSLGKVKDLEYKAGEEMPKDAFEQLEKQHCQSIKDFRKMVRKTRKLEEQEKEKQRIQ